MFTGADAGQTAAPAPGWMSAGVRVELVRVLVTTSDPVTGAGLASYLEDHPSTTLLPKEKSTEADVCVVVDDHVGTATLTRMENLARRSTTAGMRMVLITDLIQEQQFLRAVHWGLCSVLLRKEAERERVVKAVIGAHTGRAEMPPVMIAGWQSTCAPSSGTSSLPES